MKPSLSLPLTGIIPPLVTPLLDRDTLDVAGLERLLEHMLVGGIHGIFALGTTGEAPGLGYRLRRELVERVCRQVAGRVPVLVGITDTAFVESVALAKHSAQVGAAAVVLSAPYYFPAGQPELREYLSHLVPELPLPVVLYNMPSLTKITFGRDTVQAAMADPRIVGLKDSSGDMSYFHQVLHLIRQRPDWGLMIGPEELLAEATLLGGHGGVTGGANIFPKLYVELWAAAKRGDLPRTQALHAKVQQLSRTVYTVGRHPTSWLKGIKCALGVKGLCSDFMAEPFHRFRPEDRDTVAEALRVFGEPV
jgi:4-hydroxy-tetrahydrodipicolinate synthase